MDSESTHSRRETYFIPSLNNCVNQYQPKHEYCKAVMYNDRNL